MKEDDNMDFKPGEYFSFLDMNTVKRKSEGYGIIQGLLVTPITNSLAVYVSPGNAIVGCEGSSSFFGTLSTTTLNLTSDDSLPRKAAVYVTSAGNLTFTLGIISLAIPEGKVGREAQYPFVPDIPTGSTLISELWIPAGASYGSQLTIYQSEAIRNPFTWKNVVPLPSPGTISNVTDWAYTVSEGKRFLLEALCGTWELNADSNTRSGYFDVKTPTGLTIFRCPPTGTWANFTQAIHFAWQMWPGAPISDVGNEADHTRPLPDNFELYSGCSMSFYMTGMTAGDYVIIDWIAREVNEV
jgi:hypothetical protein